MADKPLALPRGRYTTAQGAYFKTYRGPAVRPPEIPGLASKLANSLVYRMQSEKLHCLAGSAVEPDGTTFRCVVFRNVRGEPMVHMHVDVPQVDSSTTTDDLSPTEFVIALAWIPEGILLTPKTAKAPYGYGMPKRDRVTGAKVNPPYGTKCVSSETMAVNQCLLNRYINNKYLDHPDHIDGLETYFMDEEALASFLEEALKPNLRLRDTVELSEDDVGSSAWVGYPFLYHPPMVEDGEFSWKDWQEWDRNTDGDPATDFMAEPGIYIGTTNWKATLKGDHLLFSQFDNAGEPVLFEGKSEHWHVHWPEELLYRNRVQEAIFQKTNEVRFNVKLVQPFTRQLRGTFDQGITTSQESRLSQEHGHFQESWRGGSESITARQITSAYNELLCHSEIMAALPSDSYELSADDHAQVALDAWIASPGHYACIVSADYDLRQAWASLQTSGPVSAALRFESYWYDHNVQLEVADDDPPVTVALHSQTFSPRYMWLPAGRCAFETAHGVVSIDEFSCPWGRWQYIVTPYKNRGKQADQDLRSCVFYKGVVYRFNTTEDFVLTGAPAQHQIAVGDRGVSVVGAHVIKKEGRLFIRAALIKYEAVRLSTLVPWRSFPGSNPWYEKITELHIVEWPAAWSPVLHGEIRGLDETYSTLWGTKHFYTTLATYTFDSNLVFFFSPFYFSDNAGTTTLVLTNFLRTPTDYYRIESSLHTLTWGEDGFELGAAQCSNNSADEGLMFHERLSAIGDLSFPYYDPAGKQQVVTIAFTDSDVTLSHPVTGDLLLQQWVAPSTSVTDYARLLWFDPCSGCMVYFRNKTVYYRNVKGEDTAIGEFGEDPYPDATTAGYSSSWIYNRWFRFDAEWSDVDDYRYCWPAPLHWVEPGSQDHLARFCTAEVARYDGRTVVAAKFGPPEYWDAYAFTPFIGPGLYMPREEKQIVWADFDLEKEIGLGALTSVTPLRVV